MLLGEWKIICYGSLNLFFIVTNENLELYSDKYLYLCYIFIYVFLVS